MALTSRLRAAGCVYAEEEADALLFEASQHTPEWLEDAAERRVRGEPLETVLGYVDFAGLRLHVAPAVFVPRTRTRVLVDQAAQHTEPNGIVVELCCGVAAVAAAVLDRRSDVRAIAHDLDPYAVAAARRNLAPYAERAETGCGDLDGALDSTLRGTVATLVANAPYVPSAAVAAMPREAREHEPRLALDGGSDGMAVQRRIVGIAPGWLRPGGLLLIETSRADAPTLAEVYESAGFEAVVIRDEDADGTCVLGRLRPRQADPR